jgi:hypothetical protein
VQSARGLPFANILWALSCWQVVIPPPAWMQAVSGYVGVAYSHLCFRLKNPIRSICSWTFFVEYVPGIHATITSLEVNLPWIHSGCQPCNPDMFFTLMCLSDSHMLCHMHACMVACRRVSAHMPVMSSTSLSVVLMAASDLGYEPEDKVTGRSLACTIFCGAGCAAS